jgi:hypothetical protein
MTTYLVFTCANPDHKESPTAPKAYVVETPTAGNPICTCGAHLLSLDPKSEESKALLAKLGAIQSRSVRFRHAQTGAWVHSPERKTDNSLPALQGPIIQKDYPLNPHQSGGPWAQGFTPTGEVCWV